jgi:hypothetical protein
LSWEGKEEEEAGGARGAVMDGLSEDEDEDDFHDTEEIELQVIRIRLSSYIYSTPVVIHPQHACRYTSTARLSLYIYSTPVVIHPQHPFVNFCTHP